MADFKRQTLNEPVGNTRPRRRRNRSLWDRIWKNDSGEVVIYSHPNKWLIGWAVLVVVSLFTTGTISLVWWYLGMGVLTVWALLETFKGVNYFRRALGVLVLLFIVLTVAFGGM